jgi:hypothetical protein
MDVMAEAPTTTAISRKAIETVSIGDRRTLATVDRSIRITPAITGLATARTAMDSVEDTIRVTASTAGTAGMGDGNRRNFKRQTTRANRV